MIIKILSLVNLIRYLLQDIYLDFYKKISKLKTYNNNN